MTEGVLTAILGALAFSHLFSLPSWIFIPLHTLAWYQLDVSLYRSLLPSSPATSTVTRPPAHDGPSFAYFKAWALRELLALPIWLFAMLGDTVGWRDEGTVYRVQRDGSVRALNDGEGEALVERLWQRVSTRWSAGRGGLNGYVTLSPDDVEARASSHIEPR